MAYNQFAYVYDTLMKEAPYEDWVHLTEEVLVEKKRSSPQTILDLGCGTGEIALRLHERGHQLIGVDYSEDMLAIAQQKAMEKGAHIQWICQDMRTLQGFSHLDMIVSYCDVLNYMLDETDVLTVFQAAMHSLSTNGIFIFDVHDDNYAVNRLANHTFAEVGEETSYIWECEATERIGRLAHHLTFFHRHHNGYYEKFSEIHEQQVFSLAQYEKLLKKVGFRKIEFSHDFQYKNSISAKDRVRNFIIAEK